MRLIDADELLESFDTFYKETVKDMPEDFVALYCTLSTMVSLCPTAYDINNVIVKMSQRI